MPCRRARGRSRRLCMSGEAILLAGDFQNDMLGASHERGFRMLGHPVHRFDLPTELQRLALPARNRLVHRLSIHHLGARRAWSRAFNDRLVQAARASEAPWVLLHNAIWVMPETVQALRKQGQRVAIFHADNPFPPHYNNRPESLPTAREANLYLVWSERLVDKLRAAGVAAHFLAFGWDPEAMPFRGDLPQGTWPGVVFVGNWDREREAFLDKVARHVPLRIYGSGYWGSRARSNGRARNCWQGRQLGLFEAARVIREAGVCLNILRTQHVIDGQPDGVIMRHFEVPGAGGVLLSTRSGVAARLFPEGHSGAYFDNPDECIRRCQELLDDAAQRARLVDNAHAEVRDHHTYAHRAAEMIAMFQSCT